MTAPVLNTFRWPQHYPPVQKLLIHCCSIRFRFLLEFRQATGTPRGRESERAEWCEEWKSFQVVAWFIQIDFCTIFDRSFWLWFSLARYTNADFFIDRYQLKYLAEMNIYPACKTNSMKIGLSQRHSSEQNVQTEKNRYKIITLPTLCKRVQTMYNKDWWNDSMILIIHPAAKKEQSANNTSCIVQH